MCLTFALIATYSMVALASDGKATGEIVVKGSNEASIVTVNGESVKSGRTIFSSSTISTPEGASAIVNLGKAGRLEIAPNTTFVLSFDQTGINGDLASGSVTVLNAAKSVSVKTASGEVIELNSGDTATSASGTASTKAATSGNNNWLVYALIFGGAVAGIVWATTQDNENQFGSGTVSPIS
jgi:hypothetical protein